MKNIQYIKSNYIEKQELLKFSNLTNSELNNLIKNELIPKASYIVESEITITSPLKDQVIETFREEYFAKHIPLLINNLKTQNNPLKYKERFKENFRKSLLEHKDRTFAYGNIFDINQNLIEEKFDNIFEAEWIAYCNGIYGICTLNATEKEIVEKEIIVKQLIEFNKKNKTFILDNVKKKELQDLNNIFNNVTNLFAPYQREASSRGKYLDKILKENKMYHKIKKY